MRAARLHFLILKFNLLFDLRSQHLGDLISHTVIKFSLDLHAEFLRLEIILNGLSHTLLALRDCVFVFDLEQQSLDYLGYLFQVLLSLALG